jgi:RNA polymerase sigma factor (sigma-70 family)
VAASTIYVEVNVMPTDSESIEQELLAVRCQLGEMPAFEELVARWHTPLWQYVRRMADRDELADEIIQETWLRLLRGIVRLRDPTKLVPWMFGIARHVMIDRLRQKYKQEAFLENAIDDLKTSAEDAGDSERRDDIANVLDKLENLAMPQRELLTLYYLDELSIDEVAQVIGVPVGTVKSRLYHARNNLKQALLTKERAR